MAEPSPTPELDFRRFATTGDPEALARVFDATAPKLLLLARHVSRHAADAEDLVQTTFVEAMRRPDAWEPRRPVVAWLCSILAHRAADLSRRQTRRPTESLDEHEPLDAALRGPLDALLDREVADRVAEALERLPASEREVCVPRLVHGLSGEEMAHALARPHSTVRTQLRRGLARLRSLLPKSLAGAPALVGAGFDDRLVLARLRAEVLAAAPSTAAVALGVGGWIGAGALMKTWQWTVAAVAVVLMGGTAWMLAPSERVAPAAAQEVGVAPRIAMTDAAEASARSAEGVTNDVREPAPRSEVVAAPDAAVGHFTGTVVAELQDGRGEWVRGAPLEGLVVGWKPKDSGDFEAITHTDARGRFRIADTRGPRDHRELGIVPPASREDPAPSMRLVVEPGMPVPAGKERDLGEFPLRPWFEGLVVEVVDPSGHGIEKLSVNVRTSRLGQLPMRSGLGGANLYTDAQGRTRPMGLAPPGVWTVDIPYAPTGLAFPGGASSYEAQVAFDAAHPRHVVQLEPTDAATAVRGRVVDQRGAPIAGIRLNGVLGGRVEATSDREGRFEFQGEVGQELRRLGIQPSDLMRRRGNDRFEPPPIDDGPYPVGTDDLEIVLRRTGSLQLRVLGADGEPVERFGTHDLTLRPETDQEAVFVWNEESTKLGDHPAGRAELFSARGDHWLVVLPEAGSGHAPAGYFRYTMPANGVLELPVRLPALASRTVEVVDEDGQPFVGSQVELIVLYDDAESDLELDAVIPLEARNSGSHFGRPRRVTSATTDASGRATLAWRIDPADRLLIRVRGRDHFEVTRPDIVWDRTDLRLVAERGHTLRGRIVPPDFLEQMSKAFANTNRPAPNEPQQLLRIQLVELGSSATPEPRTIGAFPHTLTVDPDGALEVPGVPAGDWRILATIPQISAAPLDVGIVWRVPPQPAGEPQEIDLTRFVPVPVRGRIALQDTDAAPQQLVVRRLEDPSGQQWTVRLHSEDYEFLAPPDRYRLSVRTRDAEGTLLDFQDAQVLDVPPRSPGVTRDLFFLHRRLDLRVLRKDGSPLDPRAFVHVAQDGMVRGLMARPDGSWRLDPAPESGTTILLLGPSPGGGDTQHQFELHWNPGETTIERTLRLPW